MFNIINKSYRFLSELPIHINTLIINKHFWSIKIMPLSLAAVKIDHGKDATCMGEKLRTSI